MLFTLVLIVTGCGKQPKIDELNNGVYHYSNSLLKLEMDLPKEFEDYQVQVITGRNSKNEQVSDWKDLEILVPTSDLSFERVGGAYVKPVTVRVFEAGKFEEAPGFEKIVEGKDKSYSIKFWDKWPKDWQGKWKSDFADNIKKSFKVIK